MNDASADMEARYRALLMQRTGEERLIMDCAMRDTARTFVEASLREKNPDATIAAIRQGLFLRSYGYEFAAPTREKILAAIEQVASQENNGCRHHCLLSFSPLTIFSPRLGDFVTNYHE